jgi:hypothetical protein
MRTIGHWQIAERRATTRSMTDETIDVAPVRAAKTDRTWLAGLAGVIGVILLLAALLLRTL